MNRAQLERLGADTLRRLARQIGLPGALHHPRQALLTGLCAYFERRAPAPEDADEQAEEPARPEDLPPALATETMARVLEAQGKAREAAALRQRLARKTPQRDPRDPDEVAIEHAGRHRVTIRYRLTTRLPEPLLEVWFWSRDDPPDVRRLSLTTDEGCCSLEPPAGAQLTCALLGLCTPGQGFDPLCRTPVLTLDESAGPGAGPP